MNVKKTWFKYSGCVSLKMLALHTPCLGCVPLVKNHWCNGKGVCFIATVFWY